MIDLREGGPRPSRAHRAGFRIIRAASAVMAVVLALPTVAMTQGASPAAIDGEPAVVVARGPFGSVVGLPLPDGASLPDAASLEALDGYGRGARVIIAPAVEAFERWRVTAIREPSLDPVTAQELGAGESDTSAGVRLPSSGLFLVRLDATLVDPGSATDPGTTGAWAWRIGVPDRDVPTGGDPYPPMPAIQLISADRSVDLDPGSGCFIGTCGDIGATSPPQTLPTIRTIPGTALSVRLSDGSGIDAWRVDATPVGAAEDATIPLGTGVPAQAAHTVTFAAPSQGRWVILVHIRFDRDRGAADGYARLILAPG